MLMTPTEYYSRKIQAQFDSFTQMQKKIGVDCKFELRLQLHTFGRSIGGGAFAEAFSLRSDPNVVVKNFSVDSEDCYADYLKWVLDRQDCKYVPKIYKVVQVNGDFLVFMKRYSDTRSSEVGEDLYNTIGQTESWRGAGDMNMERLTKYGEDFVSFVKELCEEFKDYNTDMHAGNVMLDEDGTPIITDPITTRKAKEITFGSCKFKAPSGFKWSFQPLVVRKSHSEDTPVEKFKFAGLEIPKKRVNVKGTPVWEAGFKHNKNMRFA